MQQLPQRRPARIALGILAAASAFVQILTAINAQPKTIGLTDGMDRLAQEDALSQDFLQIQNVMVVNHIRFILWPHGK